MVSKEEAKYAHDKHILTTKGHQLLDNKATALTLGITEENFDKIHEELRGYKYGEQEKEVEQDVLIEFLELIKDKKMSDATELLTEKTLKHLTIYTTQDDKNSEMWVYDEGIYVPNGRTKVKELLRQVLGKFFSMYYYNQVIAKIEADTYIQQESFFQNNYVHEVPVQNGILNVLTKNIKPFTPQKIFFNKLPVQYDPECECPQILQFFDEVFRSEDDKKVFCELGGYCLLKEYKFEKAFMFVGDGRNGKDKALDLLRRVIGIHNFASVPLSCLDPDSFRISELFGKMVNVAADIGSTDLKDTSMFKSLTGRSVVSGKRKFYTDVVFENYAKFIFACNQLPMVYDLSKGFWDRWVLFEFPNTFVDENELETAVSKENLKLRDEDKIKKISSPEELSGLLNLFIEGLHRLLSNKRFSTSKGTEEIKNLWIRKANSFIAFCMDKLEEDYDGKISKKDLRKQYAKYCKEHKVAGKSDKMIKIILQEQFGASEDRFSTGLNDYYDRFWVGVRWKK